VRIHIITGPIRSTTIRQFASGFITMLRRHHHIARIALLACAAWLTAAPPATGQQTGVELPRLLNQNEIDQQIRASHPPAQRDSGVDGHALLWFRIREDSTVDPASISVRGVSSAAFAEPATALAARMRFAPARVGGRPMAAWTTHHVWFRAPRRTPPRWAGAVPPDEGTYELSAVEELPVIRNPAGVGRQIAARYPPALRESGVWGGVVLRFRLMENGTVEPSSLSVELTTDPAFDEPAMAVVREMRFQPAKVNELPIGFMTVPTAPAPADSAATPPGARPPA
jgi:TonB family protein